MANRTMKEDSSGGLILALCRPSRLGTYPRRVFVCSRTARIYICADAFSIKQSTCDFDFLDGSEPTGLSVVVPCSP